MRSYCKSNFLFRSFDNIKSVVGWPHVIIDLFLLIISCSFDSRNLVCIHIFILF